jgi:TPR repeat protein
MPLLDHAGAVPPGLRYRAAMRARGRAAIVAILLGAVLGLAAGAPTITAGQQARLDDALRHYESGQLEAARAAFEALAREGVPAALFNLGVMHLRGEQPRPDPVAGERLLVQAAQRGFVTAMVALGQGWENGAFGARDLVRAHHWYELAAEAGSVEAQLAMGTAYFLGRGRPRDAAAAARWYREAARGGDVGAMYLIASMYEAGDGVERDLRLARYWYDAAARHGDEAAPDKLRAIDAQLAAQPG